ncbi:MAG: thioredoxin domain-containing protein [Ignavibacterium sp.]|nr:thioredoxin domain-containing protein [Ignavibacterium sp.]
MFEKHNRLIKEKSQYLLQHAYNPVDWYPWCDEAFEKAKLEDKPIFLSIGYSTCHWCHVMEKESFEDEEVAKLMNDTFISIKVDREERPDIDGIYMKVCQMITGGGGWPLTVIMTPDKKPFFVGTYFPKRQRFNRIGMMELIPKIKEFWLSKRNEILQSADEITKSLNQISNRKIEGKLDKDVIQKAYQQFENRFDKTYGGFGEAPKFPSPHNLIFLMRYCYTNNTTQIPPLQMVEKTLTQMRLGGIYDHIGFGFYRYSTDRFWLVPHFEKMLYDQAMILMAYSEAYQITKNQLFKKTSEEIIDYVSRVMTSEDGAFFCAEDADSEGEEGKFYLWTKKEIEEILPKDFSEHFIKIFNIESGGNYHDEAKGIRTGKNILHLKKSLSEISKEISLDYDVLIKKVEECRKILFNQREKRVHPLRDEKILTDWNSLMISALVKAYLIFNNEEYLQRAENAYNFIKSKLWNGYRLFHRFKDGEVKFDGNLDDYSFFIQANLDLFEATSKSGYLKFAIQLNSILNEKFWDNGNGGYFFTSSDSEELISRQKEIYDGAIPSGNSVQFMNLIRLARITNDSSYNDFIEKQIESFSGEIQRYPSAYSNFLTAFVNYNSPSIEIVISGNDIKVVEARNEIFKFYLPNKTLICLTKSNQDELFEILPHLRNYKTENELKIFVCNNFVCNNPVNNIEDALKILKLY